MTVLMISPLHAFLGCVLKLKWSGPRALLIVVDEVVDESKFEILACIKQPNKVMHIVPQSKLL